MDEAPEARIARLEREVQELGERLARATEALARLEGAAPGRASSLRVHVRCPICDGRSVLRIFRIADQTDTGAVPFAPLVAESGWSARPYGRFVVYVCRGCGYAEWYVGGVAELPTEHAGVELLEGPPVPPERGPFR